MVAKMVAVMAILLSIFFGGISFFLFLNWAKVACIICVLVTAISPKFFPENE